jgi:hypothetical protein
VSETSLRVVAHGAVENPHRLDTSRDRGKMHVDPPQDFTWDDFIDIINPLQHLPLVSILYRELTGDEIKPAMRILGDIGYGGPMGFLSSCGQVLFEAIFGDDMAGTAIAVITGEDEDKTAVQLASTDPSSTPLPHANTAEAARTYAAFKVERGTHR